MLVQRFVHRSFIYLFIAQKWKQPKFSSTGETGVSKQWIIFLSFHFWGATLLSSTVATPSYIPQGCLHVLGSSDRLVFGRTILMDVKWCFSVAFTCISLMTNDVKSILLRGLSAICTSLEKCVFKPCAHFLISLLGFVVAAVDF